MRWVLGIMSSLWTLGVVSALVGFGERIWRRFGPGPIEAQTFGESAVELGASAGAILAWVFAFFVHRYLRGNDRRHRRYRLLSAGTALMLSLVSLGLVASRFAAPAPALAVYVAQVSDSHEDPYGLTRIVRNYMADVASESGAFSVFHTNDYFEPADSIGAIQAAADDGAAIVFFGSYVTSATDVHLDVRGVARNVTQPQLRPIVRPAASFDSFSAQLDLARRFACWALLARGVELQDAATSNASLMDSVRVLSFAIREGAESESCRNMALLRRAWAYTDGRVFSAALRDADEVIHSIESGVLPPEECGCVSKGYAYWVRGRTNAYARRDQEAIADLTVSIEHPYEPTAVLLFGDKMVGPSLSDIPSDRLAASSNRGQAMAYFFRSRLQRRLGNLHAWRDDYQMAVKYGAGAYPDNWDDLPPTARAE